MRRGTSPPPSSTPHPPLPTRLVRSTVAVRLSHADVISGRTSEAYGNVTGRRWTRWVLTHSSPPTGRTLCCTSPRWQRQLWVKQEAGPGRQALAHTRSLSDILHLCCLTFLVSWCADPSTRPDPGVLSDSCNPEWNFFLYRI